MNTGLKGFLVLISLLVLISSLFGCSYAVTREGDFFGRDDQSGSPAATPAPTAVPSAPSDSENWTILIYLNGSNLESEGGEATINLQSLLNVALPESIHMLIYTGGTAVWQNDVIDPGSNQIWSVENQGLTLLQSMDAASMGESGTLAEFLRFAQTNYPADKKALLFWDHGAGSIDGFGADELFGYDALLLSELAQAFYDSYDGQPFDLIGFDACLMASAETADALSPYASYLVASEETEPGGGWNYEYSFGQLAQDPGMTGEELGICITDGYYAKYADTTLEGMITCSVIDLSKIPALEEKLGAFSEGISGSIVQRESMSTLAMARQNAETYGEAPGMVSYDMIDLYDFVSLQQDTNQAVADGLLAAIDDAVIYEVSGSQRIYSYGLSIFFPFAAKEYFGYNLDIYNTLDFCPEYKDLVARFANQLTDQTYLAQVPDYQSQLIEEAAGTDGDYSEIGSYYVTLSDEEMDYMCYVYCTLGYYLNDDTLIDLGYDSDLTINYSDNTIHDDFEGCWTGLNGQPVAVYVMEETEEYIIYNIPVLYNGEKAVVKGSWTWDSSYDEGGYYSYNGIFYTNDEFAAPSTKLEIDLQPGDAITPLYSLYGADEGYYEGNAFYVGDDGLYLEWIWLPDGDYEYGFVFIDVYGNVHYSDFINFEVYE